MPRALLPTAALCLVVPALTSCGLLGGGSHLDDALDALPDDAAQVQFVDRAALAERLDIEDADVDDYLDATIDDVVSGTRLAPYLEDMAEGAAFDERDIVWSVTAEIDDGPVTIYRLDDDVDLDDLADDLIDAGLAEDEVVGRRHLRGAVDDVSDEFGYISEVYPYELAEVTIDDDDHLLVVGANAAAVFETLDGDRDSLTDADTYDEVLGDVDDVEYAVLDGDPSCADPRASPELRAEIGADDLATPSATAYLVSGEDAVQTARLEFADDDAAEADLGSRTDYLDDGLLLGTQRPFSDYGDAELERDGSVVQVDLDLDDPRTGTRMAFDRDGYFACSSSD